MPSICFSIVRLLYEINVSKYMNRSVRNSDAVFLGWQEIPWGSPTALYYITAADHPSYGSTVSKDTLRKLHLQIPQTPPRRRQGEKFSHSAAVLEKN
jgi:hypothetical protein